MSGGTCQPGDITVRTGERGFVVGYVLKIGRAARKLIHSPLEK
jgi:hypothetical protein